MTTTMTKTDLIRSIASETGLPQTAVGNVIDRLGAAIGNATAEGTTVTTGWGRFVPRHRPARKGRNPRTGEEIAIAARTTVAFRVSKRNA